MLRQGQESILSSCAFTEQALHHGSATEVLLVQKQMGERLRELAARPFPEHPHENAQLEFHAEPEGLRRSIQNLGALLTTSATAHTTVATGEGLRQAVVGQPCSLSVTTKDKDGALVRSGGARLRFAVTGPDGAAAEAEVQDNRNGTYELVYTPRTEGDFVLSILLYGQPVRGSPFRARALRPSDVPPSPEEAKRRVKSPGGGHVRQKALRRPASMYGSAKRKENPIEDELIFRVGEQGPGDPGAVGVSWDGGGLVRAPHSHRDSPGRWCLPGLLMAPWGGGGGPQEVAGVYQEGEWSPGAPCAPLTGACRQPWPGEGRVHKPAGDLHIQRWPHRRGRQQQPVCAGMDTLGTSNPPQDPH